MAFNIHDQFFNVTDLTDDEYETLETKFFEIFGNDKNPEEIEIIETERLQQRVFIRCQFQNNTFIVRI